MDNLQPTDSCDEVRKLVVHAKRAIVSRLNGLRLERPYSEFRHLEDFFACERSHAERTG